MIQTIFISKSTEEIPLVSDFCRENGIQLYASSLIEFKGIPFSLSALPDIVCFTSPRSVHFFLNEVDHPNALYASVGPSTAKCLSKHGLNASFIGSTPGDPDATALSFSQWVGERSVLFPESDRGLGSLTKYLKKDQFRRVTVYKTIFNSESVPLQDAYVFTSPSNAESFLLKNPSPEGLIIAWGKSTENYLKSKGIQVHKILLSSGESELISLLESTSI